MYKKIEKLVYSFYKIASLFDIEPSEYSEEEHYEDINQEEIEREIKWGNVYCERNICWIGRSGRMVRADVNNIYPIHGNPFDRSKIKSLIDKIERSEDKVYLYAPYGNVKKVDLLDVQESFPGYDHNPLTTGDDDLDDYLKDKEEYLSVYDEEDDERLNMEREMEAKLKTAVSLNSGNLGDFIFEIRDGNHRAFAAKYSGENYIWITISENQIQDINDKDDRYGDDYKHLLQ